MEAYLDHFTVFAIVVVEGGSVGPAGGTVASADGRFALEFPAGALDEVVEFVIQKLDDAVFADDPFYVPGTGYDVQPEGLVFEEPVRLSIHYDPANLPDGMLHERLRLQTRSGEGEQWQETQRHRLRRQEHVVEGEIEHLSTFAIRGRNPDEIPVAGLTLSPPSMSLGVGQVGEFSVTALDEDGIPLDHAVYTWSTSNQAVATVSARGQGSASATGEVTGVAEGTATITVETGGVSASATVLVGVTPPPPPPPGGTVASVTVTPSIATVAVGGTQQFTAVARDADGNILSRTFNWQSSNTSVATVNSTGLVTGVATGTATITASAGSVSGSATVQVGTPVATVVIDRSGNEPVEIGLTLQLSATAYDAAGVPVDAIISWSSTDPGIATVDGDGLVTGVARGTVTITASVGVASDQVEVRVVGEAGSYGNNMSRPTVFVDGVGVTGLPVETDPGVRPTPAEGITVDALPFFWEGNSPTYGVYYEQQTFNTWRAEVVDGSGQPTYDASIYWGDALVSRQATVSRPIRVEQTLSATGMALTGFNMTYLFGQGATEMWGTDGSIGSFEPTIYTVGPRLTVQKLSGEGGSPVATVTDQVVGSEVNVAGKIIYGYNLRISSWTPPAGVTLDGWYRLTFTLATQANVTLTAVGNTEGDAPQAGTLPEVSASGRYSWIDIYVAP